MVTAVEIAGRRVGPGNPCLIIAEVGVNHNGSLELAFRLVDTAVNAGADVVKFQTFNTASLVSPEAPKADYQLEATGAEESHFEMLRRLELSPEAHRDLMHYAQSKGILFMSTPFEEASADFLADLGVAGFKIPSGEITNLPFLAHVARKGKPMIVSTGMASLAEVENSVRVIEATGNRNLILLHCVSNYPTRPQDVNLRAMQTLLEAFGVPVGFSDHTLGIEISFAAVALGACVIEKHFTLSRGLSGPDHQASLEPEELEALVRGIRMVEAALGHGRKEPAAGESQVAAIARKSLTTTRDLAAGTVLTTEMVALKRPGTGLPASQLPYVIGRTVRQDIKANSLLTWEILN